MKNILVTGGTTFVSKFVPEYFLNVDEQSSLLENTKPLQQGIKEAFSWYKNNKTDVNRKPYNEFIEKYLC